MLKYPLGGGTIRQLLGGVVRGTSVSPGDPWEKPGDESIARDSLCQRWSDFMRGLWARFLEPLPEPRFGPPDYPNSVQSEKNRGVKGLSFVFCVGQNLSR